MLKRLFGDIWQEYLKSIPSTQNLKNKIYLAKHFLPVFQDKNIKEITVTDIGKLIAGATNKLTRGLLIFNLYRLCRKGGGLLPLKWDDVDMQNGIIAIKSTKTRHDRHIPISKPLKEILSRIILFHHL